MFSGIQNLPEKQKLLVCQPAKLRNLIWIDCSISCKFQQYLELLAALRFFSLALELHEPTLESVEAPQR